MGSHNLYASLMDLHTDDGGEHEPVTSISDSVSANDTYAGREDEDEEEEDEYEEEDIITTTLFDLQALDRPPVFTSGLLQKIASDIRSISTTRNRLGDQLGPSSLYWTSHDGISVKIWKEVNGANDIRVNYMTRIEMSPQFQRRFGNEWKRSKPLRALNPDLPESKLDDLAMPYYLESFRRAPDNTHLNPQAMDWWRDTLSDTQDLWESSSSRRQICQMVRGGAARLQTPITKIVCIGLGELDRNLAFYQSTVQHMTAISFADTLDAYNRTAYPDCAPVKIIAQDPCYKACDRILLQELTKTPIDFSLSDPETLLSIDAGTIVITAFLPHTVPLMQILADLFAGRPGDGPAMILGDRIANPGAKTKWCFRNRDQPGVAKFLNGYIQHPTEFVGLEKELRRELCGSKPGLQYWLAGMMFCLRRDVKEMKKV